MGPIAVLLAKAIRNSGRSYRDIARGSEMEPSVITRFMRGSDIMLGAVDRLFGALGLEVTATPRQSTAHASKPEKRAKATKRTSGTKAAKRAKSGGGSKSTKARGTR